MPSDNDYRVEYEDQVYDDYSLESILAEYKGTAYIDGDRKTPRDVLNEKAERIVLEVTGDNRGEAEITVPEKASAPEKNKAEADFDGGIISQYLQDSMPEEVRYAAKAALLPEDEPLSDTTTFKNRKTAKTTASVDNDSETKVFEASSDNSERQKKRGFMYRVRNLWNEPEDDDEDETAEDESVVFEEPVKEETAPNEAIQASEPVQPIYEADDGEVAKSIAEEVKEAFADNGMSFETPVTGFNELQPDLEEEPDAHGETSRFVPKIDFFRGKKTADDGETEVFTPVSALSKKIFTIPRFGKTHEEAEPGEKNEKQTIREPKLVEDPVFEEPDLKEAGRKFAAACNSVSLKSFTAFVISIISAVFTYVFEANGRMGFGIGSDISVFSGVLLIMQLIVMALCVRVILRGVTDIFKLRPGAESLLFLSCLVTAVSAVLTVAFPDKIAFTPYCAVSSFACAFFMWGEKLHLSGITESLRGSVNSSSPVGVLAEYSERIDRVIVKKVSGSTAGFYNNLIAPDISESAFRVFAPIIAAISFVLALLASIKSGNGSAFFHIFAAILAGGTSFFALLCFALPFSAMSRKLRTLGASIAGWGGADDIYYSDGACVRDDDIFPTGTVKLAGMKLYEGETPEKAIRYTASIVIASGSGLSKLFAGLLNQHGLSLAGVESFEYIEGGNSGYVNGDRVLVGSSAFLNLMGIRVPDSVIVPNSVYTAINNKLVAVFNVEYMPVNSVQSALLALIGAKVKIFFAAKDFNLTPIMLEKKFKTPVEDVEYIPVQESYSISDENGTGSGADAILSREGLGSFGMAVASGKRLRVITLVSTAVTVFVSVLGAVLMFALCWTGSFDAACAGNLLLFMIISVIVEAVISYVLRFIK